MLHRLLLSVVLILASHAVSAGVLVLRGGTRVEVDRIVVTGHRVYAYPPGGGLGVAYDIDDVDLEATRLANAERQAETAPEQPAPAPPPATPSSAVAPEATAAAERPSDCFSRSISLASSELALLIRDQVEIHASADLSSPVIGLGGRCEVLTLVGVRGRWCVVRMASGKDRFIDRDACAGADPERLSLPTAAAERRSIYAAVQAARAHAAATSERLYPSRRQRRRHNRHRAQLVDRYVLEVLHEVGLSPAALPVIETEAEREGWDH
jgi:hypothetical protein